MQRTDIKKSESSGKTVGYLACTMLRQEKVIVKKTLKE